MLQPHGITMARHHTFAALRTALAVSLPLALLPVPSNAGEQTPASKAAAKTAPAKPANGTAAAAAPKTAADSTAKAAKPAWTPSSETSSTEKATPADPAQPAAGTAQSTAFDDWVLQCTPAADGKTSCALMQRLADQKGRQIIQFTAARSKTQAYMEVSAPLGLSIPYGVALVLPDKSEIKMQLADCLVTGCRAVVPLDEATLAKFKSAERIGVRFQDSKSGKVMTVQGSLKGFANGIAKVMAAG